MLLERDFQAAVIQYAGTFGWRIYHNARADKNLRGGRGAVGFCDLILVHDDYLDGRSNRLIAAELKTGARTSTEDQRAWLSLFDRVDGAVGVLWRPDAPPMAEAYHKVETWEGAELGAIGKRLRGEQDE